MKLLLFDIDQTLINTGGAGLRALDRACLQLFGIPNAMQGISPHGKTDPAIAREILRVRLHREPAETNGEISSILEAYLSFLKDEVRVSPKYRVLPGIISLLDQIVSNQKDVMIGLATGNIEPGARIKLDRGRLNPYFAFGGFGSDSEDRAELVRKAAGKAAARRNGQISPSDVFVIGDTPLDIDAGNRAGFKTVGVGTGSYSIEQLLDSGATFAIPDFEQGRDHFLRSTFTE
ncbi:MAG TPA: HAD hydrolase-like protein [Terriglobia bacterium]|nr:HAD hydrolase-like protein [Terriglobia bacterium]